MKRYPWGVRAAGAALAIAVFAACDPGVTTTPTPTPTPSPSQDPHVDPDRPHTDLQDVRVPGIVAPLGNDLAAYQAQKVEWKPCDKLECATIYAPEDYTRPGWHAITLKVTRRPATGAKAGSLFVNPGGPGAPAADLVGDPDHWKGFPDRDIVGIDPRGTAGSTPVVCYRNQDKMPITDVLQQQQLDASPDDDAEFDALVKGDKDFAASCAANSGQWLNYVGTQNTARDMDLVRGLLGADKLDYIGASYGTALGAWYAALFPEHTGRLVLDGPVLLDQDGFSQMAAFDRSFMDFARWAAPHKLLGTSPEQVRDNTIALLEKLDSQPMRDGDKLLTQSDAVSGIATLLYGDETMYVLLETALVSARAGVPGPLRKASVLTTDPEDDGVMDQLYYAFPAIGCADVVDEGTTAARKQWADNIPEHSIFQRFGGPEVGCTVWPVRTQKAVPTAKVATPPLVLGTTLDPATPVENARPLAQNLGGVVVTWDGIGHTAFARGSSCVDDAVYAYLRSGTVPTDGLACPKK